MKKFLVSLLAPLSWSVYFYFFTKGFGEDNGLFDIAVILIPFCVFTTIWVMVYCVKEG